MRDAQPPDWAMTVMFADGHEERIPSGPSIEAIVAAAQPIIAECELEHGKAVAVTPSSDRWTAVTPELAEDLHQRGVFTMKTDGLSYDDAMDAFDDAQARGEWRLP